MPTDIFPGDRVQLRVEMPGPKLYVARIEPYRLSDLDRLLASIRTNRLVQITPIGKTVAGRELEIVRIGNPAAPYRVFMRARAHPWEPGSNWVVQGLVRRLLKGDAEAKKLLSATAFTSCRWRTRTASRSAARDSICAARISIANGTSRRRELAPENAALETWLKRMIAAGQNPISRWSCTTTAAAGCTSAARPFRSSSGISPGWPSSGAAAQEDLVHRGRDERAFHNSGTLGDGWLERYGIDAMVHEFNANWIEGLKDYPSSRNWMDYGASLAGVFHELLRAVKP